MPSRVVRVLVALLALLVAVERAAVAAPTPLPSRDAFYSYSGSKPLKKITPGVVLKRRRINVSFGATSTPITAEQLLYRTTDQLGDPSITVTTVIQPVISP